MTFWVSVPVLSLQITLTAPKVSTLGRRRVIVFTLTIRWTPSANVIVTTAGNPSGTAATAREIDNKNIFLMLSKLESFIKAITNNKVTKTRVMIPNNLERSASLFCSGVSSCLVLESIFAI